jgi:hypothetical protein
MPDPEKHESMNDYVSRFMGSKESREDFPKQSQRAAVAYSKFRKRKRK